MDSEVALWDDLRRVMGTTWAACRHEDKVTAGVPDASWIINRDSRGWIELKVLPRIPARDYFKVPKLRPAQKVWMRQRHGRGDLCQVFLRIGGKQLLVFEPPAFDALGRVAYEVFRDLPRVQLFSEVSYLSVCQAIGRGQPL